MIALFEQHPFVKEKIPHVALGDFPTPVEKMERLGQTIHAPQLYIKREDLSGKIYGGNKIRALEFLFGNAIHAGYKDVFALGFPASCQALAQAIYARKIGFKSTAFLYPQIQSEQSRRHLLIYQSIGADIRPTIPLILPFLFGYRLKHGRSPKLLEASTPTGMLGYVSAGFELKQQIEQGLMPEPDLIYVKFLHILAVTIAVGGMFARQLGRSIAKKSDDVKTVASLIQVVLRIDRAMVIPWSSAILIFGIFLAIMMKWLIFGFLQGADKNWLFVSIVLLVFMQVLIHGAFLPHNKKVAALLQTALTEGRITPELTAALHDQKNMWTHHVGEIIVLTVAALMVLKPF